MVEKREYRRLNLKLISEYSIDPNTFVPLEATVLNLNFSGICLQTQDPINEEKTITLRINTEGEEWIQVSGLVIWSKKDEESDKFLQGIRINDSNDGEKEKFERFYNLRLLYPPKETV